MKKSLTLLFILLLVPLVNAQGEEIFTSQHIVLNFNISSNVNVLPQSDYYVLSYVNAELTYFPQNDDRQSVVEQYTVPSSEKENDSLMFKWENVRTDSLSFNVNSKLKILNKQYYIPKKIDFPLKNIPHDIEEYTKASPVIDSGDPRIINLASSLAQGEDDMFVVAFKIGNWTKNNIAYDLSTLTANVSQKASWVLENRQGVCDELTSLFIAMLRSLNIPARFIAGYAYTNSELFRQKWGPHGWAEVYFPGYGWVPFDVTYGELGYIDASHIKLKASTDPNMSSTFYEWAGRDVNLETEPLIFTTSIVESGPQIEDKIRLSARVLHNMVGFGSYNLVEATVENPTLFYAAEEVMISQTESTDLVESNSKRLVLLKPGQKRTIYWIVKVDDRLNSRYVYRFPISVYTVSNLSVNTDFQSQNGETFYSLSEMEDYLNERAGEEQKVYNQNIDFSCSSDKNSYYIYETIKVSCALRNTGNTLLQAVQVCLKSNCTTIDLGITQVGNLRFEYKPESINDREIKVTAKNDKVSEAVTLTPAILDVPAVQIISLDFPKNVTYKDNFQIKFDVDKSSVAKPRNAEVFFHSNGLGQRWNFEELDAKKSFVIQLAGGSLKVGKNTFYVDVKFYDNNNQEYTATQQFEIYLAKPTLWQRIMMFFSSLF